MVTRYVRAAFGNLGDPAISQVSAAPDVDRLEERQVLGDRDGRVIGEQVAPYRAEVRDVPAVRHRSEDRLGLVGMRMGMGMGTWMGMRMGMGMETGKS